MDGIKLHKVNSFRLKYMQQNRKGEEELLLIKYQGLTNTYDPNIQRSMIFWCIRLYRWQIPPCNRLFHNSCIYWPNTWIVGEITKWVCHHPIIFYTCSMGTGLLIMLAREIDKYLVTFGTPHHDVLFRCLFVMG